MARANNKKLERCIPQKGSVAIHGARVTLNRAWALTFAGVGHRHHRGDTIVGMAWAIERGLVVETATTISAEREEPRDLDRATDYIFRLRAQTQLTASGERLVRELFEFTFEHCSWPRPFETRYMEIYYWEENERADMRRTARTLIRRLASVLPCEKKLCRVLDTDVEIIPAPPLVSPETWAAYVREQEAEERRSRIEIARD